MAVNQISDAAANALSENTKVTSLNLRGNYVDDEGAESLAKNPYLTNLDISFNEVTDEGIKALTKSTYLSSLKVRFSQYQTARRRDFSTLSTLTDLNQPQPTRIDKKILQRLRDNDPTLTLLNLHGISLNDLDIWELVKALANNTHLTSLNLGPNYITTSADILPSLGLQPFT